MQILPFAITRISADEGCVAGITPEGEWVRPKPIRSADIEGSDAPFVYKSWTEFSEGKLAISEHAEDIALTGTPRRTIRIDDDSFKKYLFDASSASVQAGFEGVRSAAVIRARILNVYVRRHLRGRLLLRIVFSDETGASFDFITPEIRFNDFVLPHRVNDELDPDFVSDTLSRFGAETFLSIGLTAPNGLFPDRFRGCHPLVVGIHTFPDYRT